MKLYFDETCYGEDFETVCDWPEGWAHGCEYPDGSIDYSESDVWFKAYDTSLCENERDRELFEQGYGFNCVVRLRYVTSGLYCEDELASFPALDRRDAERLLQITADEIYGKEEGE